MDCKSQQTLFANRSFLVHSGYRRCIRSVASSACQRHHCCHHLYPGSTEHGKIGQLKVRQQRRTGEKLQEDWYEDFYSCIWRRCILHHHFLLYEGLELSARFPVCHHPRRHPAGHLEPREQSYDLPGRGSPIPRHAQRYHIMPLLLSCLGAIFTKAGVGDAFANIFGKIIPSGNVYIGIVAYALGMVLFTIIMGNAFAAITVMTVGIGVPFVISLGANPLYMVTLAMTCGYCGTLLTPMAANFNIVPGVYLEVKDKYSIIKMQLIPSLLMLVFQIIYMCMMVNA